MMPEAVAGLEQAGWSVVVTDQSGGVRHANPAARKLFGPAVEGTSPQLAATGWPGGQSGVDEFLALAATASPPPALLRLRSKEGKAVACLTSACVLVHEGKPSYVFQMWPAPTDNGQASEEGVLHKQKLDCALQLARTVALDFNNALTSILGHT